MADRGPLPGGIYAPGTMSVVDIYPTHQGIGGISTQDRALPAFGEAVTDRMNRSVTRTDIESDLLGQPAGYFVLLLLGLAVGAWVIKG
jgi:hypothetical protein